MKTSDFYYDLPEELIAQHGTEKRDESRLLVYNRATKEIEHKHFYDIINYIEPNDCLVINNTRVMPARLIGKRVTKDDTGGKMELVLLKRIEGDNWETLVKPGRRAKVGAKFQFGNDLVATVTEILPDGNRIVQFEYNGIFEERLDEVGQMPLPPYITEKLTDAERYQTVYAHEKGSAAAPTAGLHFTTDLLDALRNKGVQIAEVMLHVGLGTFRPVKADDVEHHVMHKEYYEVTQQAADVINQTHQKGGRVIAVGTTSTRTLETVTTPDGIVQAQSGWTDIFITPGYEFKAVDALITNFHLPESTLLMLISALCSREEVLDLYILAVQERYRFFSFGDAMLIL